MFIQNILALKIYRKKLFWIPSVLFAFLAAICVFKILAPNENYQFQGQFDFTEGVSTSDTVIYEGISLKPGVYYIELQYVSDTDLVALCNMKDGTVFTGGLLTNGEHMYGGLDKTGFHMWLYESTDDMQVVVSYGGKGVLRTGDLTITETNQLWTMFLVIVIFTAAAIFSCVIYVYYNKEYGISYERKKVFFFLAVISFLASVPALYGSMLGGADLTFHLQRIEGIKDGLLGGQFPIRLESEWVYGHGYAAAIFYCNTFLYLSGLLRLAGFTVTASYNVYCIVLSIATAYIAWYCFCKIFKNSNIGLICSGLYTLSYFRIFKLYCAGAVGEGSAYTFLPLVLYGMYRVFAMDPRDRKYKTSWVPIALGYAGLIQTHVLTCEITVFLTILVCVACIRKIFCLPVFLELAKGALGALCLSMWYIVPFLDYYLTQDMHIKHVSGRTIQERGLDIPQLLNSVWRLEDDTAPIIGVVLLLGMAAFIVLWVFGNFRGKKESPVKLAMFCTLAGGLLLAMSLRFFPWDKIQSLNGLTASLVSSLQFPNRFLGWGTACLVTVYGFCLWFLKDEKKKIYWLGIAVAIAGGIVLNLYSVNCIMKEQNLLQLYNEEGMGFGYISGAEYLYQGTDEALLTFEGAHAGENIKINAYAKNYLHVEIDCTNHGTGDGYVDLPLLLYKGYKAFEMDTGREILVCDGENHLVRLVLPEGFSGSVSVDFVSPFYWRVGEIVTVLTIILFGGLWWTRRRSRG